MKSSRLLIGLGGITIAGGLVAAGMLLNQLFSGPTKEDLAKISTPTSTPVIRLAPSTITPSKTKISTVDVNLRNMIRIRERVGNLFEINQSETECYQPTTPPLLNPSLSFLEKSSEVVCIDAYVPKGAQTGNEGLVALVALFNSQDESDKFWESYFQGVAVPIPDARYPDNYRVLDTPKIGEGSVSYTWQATRKAGIESYYIVSFKERQIIVTLYGVELANNSFLNSKVMDGLARYVYGQVKKELENPTGPTTISR